MCVLKINKLAPGTAALHLESEILSDYGEWQKKPYDGIAYGTYPAGLVTILNKMNCGFWTSEKFGPVKTSKKIMELVGTENALSGPTVRVNPVIVGVNWDGTTASHWVVIDTVRTLGQDSYATICDPADANVHVQAIGSESPFIYNASVAMAVDLWGSRDDQAYSRGSKGIMRDWPVIYRVH